MSLYQKAKENEQISAYCYKEEISAYNAGASRAYYAAFQKAKAYMIEKKFDYEKFLQKIKATEKPFSHGTIQRALVECLIVNGRDKNQIYKLNVWDNLYQRRIKADYKDKMISRDEMKASLQELNTVLTVIP
ncbi:MAG TPA: hypothetical protein PLW34_03475 [Termitinemataceae bacterium]|nr:hypothetical protein [Termitinemataceae bacterium]HOM23839.1 hypothetical protein [Termitinemataceae bacterium]HPP99897.1 hypothetical protein [Termitinemataceae bacterium]